MHTRAITLAGALLALAAVGCNGDDDDMATPDADPTPTPDADPTPTPVDFAVRIENLAPWTVLSSGIVSTRADLGTSGPLGPGEAFEVTFTAGRGQRVSFVAMLGESNDWFFAPGPEGIALYDAGGAPVAGDVTDHVKLWNAGTEVDQEPFVGADTGPKQSGPEAGAPDADPTVRELAGTVTLSDGASFTLPAVADMLAVTLTPGPNRQFTLRVANASTASTLETSAGARAIHVSPLVWALHARPAPFFDAGAPDRGHGLEALAEAGRTAGLGGALAALSGAATPISPGVWVVHRGGEPIFSVGAAERGLGLERIAENGDPKPLADAFAAALPAGAIATGVFDTPAGAAMPGAARPGHAYAFTITALPGDRLSFATMFGMSNDWFFASGAGGLPLFDAAGVPRAGDVTDAIGLYDAATEIDQALAIGPDTGPQQPTPDSGAKDPVGLVREVAPATYGQPVSAHLRVTITPQ